MQIIVKSESYRSPYRSYVFSVKDIPDNKLWFSGALHFKGYAQNDEFAMGHLQNREELITQKLQEIAEIIYKDIV
jgi:hypothetical protein